MLIASATVASQSDFEMHDPVFNLRYDVRKVHFEDAPESLAQRCQGELRPDKYWIYTYWKEQESEFFVVSSLATKLDGLGLVIMNGRCIVGDAGWITTGVPPGTSAFIVGPYKGITISESARHGLDADFLRRSADAFGGKKKYLKIIGKWHIRLGDPQTDLAPEFLNEFEKFVNSR